MVDDEKEVGVDPFVQLVQTPGAATAGLPIRRCDECGHPSTMAWVLKVPVLLEHTGRELAAVFFCDSCSATAKQMLEMLQQQAGADG